VCVIIFLIVFQGKHFADTFSIGGTSVVCQSPVSILNAETRFFVFMFRPFHSVTFYAIQLSTCPPQESDF